MYIINKALDTPATAALILLMCKGGAAAAASGER
jgi:hypothetical protein